jgi:hypothetical protein
MADQSITQLPVAYTVTGNEQSVIVQGGVTKQVQISQIANAISPGKLITNVQFNSSNDLVFYYSDGTTSSAGPIPGYISATVNSSGHLILTNSTGGTTDAGYVIGPQGPTGPTGPSGTAATIAAGSVTTLAYGSPATVTNVGSPSAAIFNFGIPQGAPGGNVSIQDDTSTNATRYPVFVNQTTGTLTTEYTSSTKLQFNPATGGFSSPIVTATAGIGGGAF